MDDGLVLVSEVVMQDGNHVLILIVVDDGLVRLQWCINQCSSIKGVLILIVVDDGLVHIKNANKIEGVTNVLILIVVDDGLVRMRKMKLLEFSCVCLNPYCSGRWSRTNEENEAFRVQLRMS